MPQTVVAVAVGPMYSQVNINNNNIPAGVRKYINGFVAAFPPTIGAEYVIDYRECPAATLIRKYSQTLCKRITSCVFDQSGHGRRWSVSRGYHADHWHRLGPENYFSKSNDVCGASAERSNDARFAYRKLDTVNPALVQATVLYDPNYAPSQDPPRYSASYQSDPPAVVQTPQMFRTYRPSTSRFAHTASAR
jgi:hypothetical protein